MKTKLLLLFLLPFMSFSQNYFSENFETIIDLSAGGWTLYNDSNTPQPDYASIFPDAWGVVEWNAEGGNITASTTSWFTPAAIADRWLVTPAIVIPNDANASLTFKIRSHDDGPFADGYTLKISTMSSAKADLSTDLLVVPNAVNDIIANIEATTVDLSAYNGQTVYLAWVNTFNDGNLLSVDDISVDATLSVEDFSKIASSMYPNPANDEFKIDFNPLNDSSEINISVIDISGRLLKRFKVQEAYDISDLNIGTYLIKIADGENSFVSKLIKK